MNSTVLFGLAVVVAAPALKDKEKPPALVGEWEIVEFTVGGKPSGPDRTPNHWVFRADGSRAIHDQGGKQLVDGTYTADPKTGNLDFDSGSAINGQYLCLYKLDGDTLTLNVGWNKAPRPTAFESPVGSQCTLYTMKRVKTKD
jgi:uncharacterized protein (TIGR03067 family)